jgi:hypothetical protein
MAVTGAHSRPVPVMYKLSCGAAALEINQRLARIFRKHWTWFAKARPGQMFHVAGWRCPPRSRPRQWSRASRVPDAELRALPEPTRAEGVPRV